ncbi:MAG: pseudouridine synthase [Polyangiales bacterium]
MADGERLQKVLARGGVASRREAETLITEGRVKVNGEVVRTLGTRVDPAVDRVEVDGREVEAEARVYFLFHKPRGVVTTLEDPEGRPSIKDYVKDVGARVFPVGRLDFHTSGALLLTNDGALANALLHPTKSVAKTYVAKVRGVPTDEQIQRLRTGVELAPIGDERGVERTRPAEVEVLRSVPSGEGSVREDGTTWLQITLREGKNRQIHRMAEAVGLFVMRLARISFAGINTEGLRAGQIRELTPGEASLLRRTYLGESDFDEDVRPKPRERAPARSAAPSPTRRDDERRPARGEDRRAPPRHESDAKPTRSAKPKSAPHRDDRARPATKDDRDARSRAPSERSKRETRTSDTRSTAAKKPRKR